jgi:hypothetical protein
MRIASIATHESGNAVAGWAVGTPACRLTVAPMRALPEPPTARQACMKPFLG